MRNPVVRNDRERQRTYAKPRPGGDDGGRQERLAYRRWLDVENQERQRDGEDAVTDRDHTTWVLREWSVFGSVDVVSSCFACRHDETEDSPEHTLRIKCLSGFGHPASHVQIRVVSRISPRKDADRAARLKFPPSLRRGRPPLQAGGVLPSPAFQ